MLFEAFGDHQVANVATEVMARTIDAELRVPALAPGRSPDVQPFWGIDTDGRLPDAMARTWSCGTSARRPRRSRTSPTGPALIPTARAVTSSRF